MQTLISVVVPVYNREKHLCECVDRVLAQTFTDFELVLVDDGSTDRSAEICDAYAKKDTRVKVIHKQNGGVSSARNEGIAASSGEYITFIDSDDSVDADFLEYAYKRMSDGGFDLFVTGIVMEYWENGEITDKVEYRINGDRVFDRRGLLEAWEKEYPIILTSGPWCKLYKASIIKENDIQFDTSLSCGEDTYFNLDVIRKINSVCISAEMIRILFSVDFIAPPMKYISRSWEK